MKKELLIKFYRELMVLFRFVLEDILDIPNEYLEYKQNIRDIDHRLEKFLFDTSEYPDLEATSVFMTELPDDQYDIYHGLNSDGTIEIIRSNDHLDESETSNKFYDTIMRLYDDLEIVEDFRYNSWLEPSGAIVFAIIIPTEESYNFLVELNGSSDDLKRMVLKII